MPRFNLDTEIFEYLNQVYKYVEERTNGVPVVKFTNAPMVAGTTTQIPLAVADQGAFPAGSHVMIKSAVGADFYKSLSGATQTISQGKALTSHPSGARVSKLKQIDMGAVSEIQYTTSQDVSDVVAGNRRTVMTYIRRAVKQSLSFRLKMYNNLNLGTFAAAQAEDSGFEVGNGTAADPYTVILNGLNIGRETPHVWSFMGTTQMGDTVQTDICDATLRVDGSITWGGDQPPEIPVTMDFTTLISRIWQ